jgi:glycosyltransferase involved in cell wall biosynthesis
MRILFLSPIGSLGGAERVLLTAVTGIRRTDPAAVVRVLAFSDGPLIGAVRALGAQVQVVPAPVAVGRMGDSQLRAAGKWRGRLALVASAVWAAPAGVRFITQLRSAIARFAPDVVHSNGIKTHLLSRFVPRRAAVVWHVHDFYGQRPLAAKLLRWGRRRVRAGVAISSAVAADAAKVLPGVPITTVPNAVDLSRFSPGPLGAEALPLDQLAGLSPAPPGTVRVGLVATYARWKGHLAVLDAARRLAEDAPELPVRWYIIGGPIYHTAAQFTEEELRAAAGARGVGERVGFVPFQADPAGAYRALDVVVHASTLPEPFGLTVAESMACGRAVVVSAAGGAAELFTDGYDGLAVVPGDAAGIASAVGRLAADSGLRTQLGARARATAEARFDDARYGPQLMAVYRKLLP